MTALSNPSTKATERRLASHAGVCIWLSSLAALVSVSSACSRNESCNWKDDDRDGLIDEGFDADGDGAWECGVTAADAAAGNADCDDSNAEIYPGATEQCNGHDDNCDGVVDEGCSEVLLEAEGRLLEVTTADYGDSSQVAEGITIYYRINSESTSTSLGRVVIVSNSGQDGNLVVHPPQQPQYFESPYSFISIGSAALGGQRFALVQQYFVSTYESNNDDELVFQDEGYFLWDDEAGYSSLGH